jgi:class 3 adenylate cyclase
MKSQDKLHQAGIECLIGVTFGEVLLFLLGSESYQIAGEPVNIASKPAEDIGKPGHIYIHENIDKKALGKIKSKPFAIEVSHVEIRGEVLQ